MSVETSKSGLDRERTLPPRNGWRLFSVLGASLLAIGLAAAPSQAQATSCNNTSMGGTEIEGDVVVPVGAFCTLADATVTGDVDVSDGAVLFIDRSRVQGSLTGGADTFIDMYQTRVDGMTTLSGSFGLNAHTSRFNRTILSTNSEVLQSIDSTHWGGMTANGNSDIVVQGGVVLGSVRTVDSGFTDVDDTAAFGLVSVERAEDGALVCDVGAGFGVSVRDSTGPIQIGDGPAQSCGFNVLGQIQVHDNTGDIALNGNLVASEMSCTGNNPAPTGSNNFVLGGKTGQCADLSPTPESSSSTIMVDPITAPRTERIQAQIDAYLAAHPAL